ncbi:MAG TPA: Gfo/Idh/MocA family oxidoreductase [Lacunisphaera sp.]|nr:Gfo/Idh/MocA family oxidoreductase [Lacunisphaera sp.]
MTSINRRSFLKTTALALGAGVASRSVTSVWAQPAGANGDVRIGVIGLGRKGTAHLDELRKLTGVRVTALCDVDPRALAAVTGAWPGGAPAPFSTTDARRLLERPDVDAVLVVSPNHWHALHTVWACEAGKDVYVEKPVSHSVWEGVQVVRAAARHGRVVQAGTQMRSDIAMPQVIEYLRQGHLGRILWVHSVCYKERTGIGRRRPWYPDWLDYDLFCGPAPVAPLVRDELAYDWHWFWDTGNGDLANIGIHEFDVGRWVAGHTGAPRRIISLGGRFGFDDSGETPNTQATFFDYPGLPIVLENRVLPAKPGVKYMDHVHGVRQGVVVHCEGGYFAGRYGGDCFDHTGRRLAHFAGDGGANHLPNFIAAVRSRRTADLAAPIETGRVSTSTCLYGNVSYRIGAPATLAEARAALGDLVPAAPVLDSLAAHLTVHGVDLTRPSLALGPWLEVDAGLADVTAVEGRAAAALDEARWLLKGAMRPPYVLAEQPA